MRITTRSTVADMCGIDLAETRFNAFTVSLFTADPAKEITSAGRHLAVPSFYNVFSHTILSVNMSHLYPSEIFSSTLKLSH